MQTGSTKARDRQGRVRSAAHRTLVSRRAMGDQLVGMKSGQTPMLFGLRVFGILHHRNGYP
ncbi:hypothetical protein [Rhizobium sp. BK602]|uniref:hypothetical protein n=1 Tax=Rhizobium sp. BK602 TaxID=2586986 RepID=UPI0017FD9B17|nr:hypothetical protein [Rhizobium sp. BK602]MBB3610694.1 hypothetical protein [Rhizobium sp. BK602]